MIPFITRAAAVLPLIREGLLLGERMLSVTVDAKRDESHARDFGGWRK
jgi:hypothetical protein